jgi:uncharacterized membrane protein YgcG
VPSLDEDLEAFAVRVFVAWKLGDKGWDNGVLVLVARDDRKVRIEVGYGAEGALTDAKAGRIIRATIAPAFREGRYGEGLYTAGVQILTTLGALPSGLEGQVAGEPEPMPAGIKVLMAMFLPLVLLFVFYWGWVLSGIVRNLAGVIRKLIRGEPVLEPVSGGGKVGSGGGSSGAGWSSGGTGWSSGWSSSGSGSWSSSGGSWSGGSRDGRTRTRQERARARHVAPVRWSGADRARRRGARPGSRGGRESTQAHLPPRAHDPLLPGGASAQWLPPHLEVRRARHVRLHRAAHQSLPHGKAEHRRDRDPAGGADGTEVPLTNADFQMNVREYREGGVVEPGGGKLVTEFSMPASVRKQLQRGKKRLKFPLCTWRRSSPPLWR